jgi:hypothetical protein
MIYICEVCIVSINKPAAHIYASRLCNPTSFAFARRRRLWTGGSGLGEAQASVRRRHKIACRRQALVWRLHDVVRRLGLQACGPLVGPNYEGA